MTTKSEDEEPGAISLPEYRDNPFIARLPPLLSQKQILQQMASQPAFDEQERNYPAYVRKHCVLRLSRYFEPLSRQLQLAERFGMLLRQGYVGRNPATHDYTRHLQSGAERIAAHTLDAPLRHPVENTATSFALVGCSGIGKSKSMEKVLHLYPQCIQHSEPFSLIQIAWLKLECPPQGSPKQLCIHFFASIDQLIGTNYSKIYGHRRAAMDEMMLNMAHVANLHALGVLVIDEIQHLNGAKTASGGLLNFLVALVNTVAIPVILIGTLSAVPILQENFRQARRASGLGSLVWDRLPQDKAWDYFIDSLWRYQWTREVTPLSPDIRAVLYDESQGIIDIVVKLVMLAQLRMIGIGEIRDKPERLTTNLLRTVAREDLQIVRPMLDALRKNDNRALLKYDDLLPLQKHVENLIEAALGAPADLSDRFERTPHQGAATPPAEAGDDPMLKALAALNIADDVAQALIDRARRENPSADPLLLMASISAQLSAQPPQVKKTKPAIAVSVQPDQDLRRIVRLGEPAGQSGYSALLAVGMIKSPMRDFVH